MRCYKLSYRKFGEISTKKLTKPYVCPYNRRKEGAGGQTFPKEGICRTKRLFIGNQVILMEEENNKYLESLKGMSLSVVVLDKDWHKLFAGRKKPMNVKKLEQELNDMIKLQGKCNTERKDLKKLKNKLMEEIVENMEQSQEHPKDKKIAKKMEDNQRLIKEINEKMDACEEQLVELPRQIRETNLKLMVASMEACYRYLHKNGEDIYAIEEWIKAVRQELNKNILIKQEREEKNLQIYTYMHHILGPRVLDLFDMKYLKAWKPPEDFDEKEKAEGKETEKVEGKETKKAEEKEAEKTEGGEEA